MNEELEVLLRIYRQQLQGALDAAFSAQAKLILAEEKLKRLEQSDKPELRAVE